MQLAPDPQKLEIPLLQTLLTSPCSNPGISTISASSFAHLKLFKLPLVGGNKNENVNLTENLLIKLNYQQNKKQMEPQQKCIIYLNALNNI